MILDMIEAMFVGVMAAVTILYTFQTRILYPEWMLQAFEHPWIFLCMLLAAALFAPANPRITVMMMLLLLALWFDWILFARPDVKQQNRRKKENPVNPYVSSSSNQTLVAEVWPFDQSSSRRQPTPNASQQMEPFEVVPPKYPVFHHLDDFIYGPAAFN